jgi:NADP+-dependent farnesol dehydrogenase
MEKWQGKTAVVTGASAGIGAQIVRDLANAGVNVVALARRADKLEELKSELKDAKGKVGVFCCDVSDVKSVEAAFAYVEKEFGGTDILVNNAGIISNVKIFHDTPDITQKLAKIVETNFLGTVWCAREAFKSMTKRDVHGHIINMNSVAGHSVAFTGTDVPSHNMYPGK